MIGVGVAANNVQGIYEGNIPSPNYITLNCDIVIKTLVYPYSTLPSNLECEWDGEEWLNHGFINEYLGRENSKVELLKLLQSGITELNSKPSQFIIEELMCSNVDIPVVDRNITISIVNDIDGKVYDINGTLVMSLTYDTNLSSFKIRKGDTGYLTLIHNADNDLLRKSEPMPDYDTHKEYKLLMTPLYSIESQYGFLTDETYSKLYYSEGVTKDPNYYLNDSNITISENNNSLYANKQLLPIKYYEGWDGTHNLFSDIQISKIEKIYSLDNVKEFKIDYCK